MFYIFTATLIFGMVHPGAKYLFNNQISTLSFCFLYIFFRLLFILPFSLFQKNNFTSVLIKSNFINFLLIGIVGACLQFLEFYSLNNGLPVSTVTFLVSLTPIWIYLYTFFNKSADQGGSPLLATLISFIGLVLISHIHFADFGSMKLFNFLLLLAPILAGGCIAMWVILSAKLKKNKVPSFTISFFYDFFALLTIFLILASTNKIDVSYYEIKTFLNNSSNLRGIIIFSVLIGLLPNILFYIGSKSCSPIKTGLILLLEPICATIFSKYLFGEVLSDVFYLGATLIILANIPKDAYKTLYRFAYKNLFTVMPLQLQIQPSIKIKNRFSQIMIKIFIIATLLAMASVGMSQTLNLVEIYPASKSDYIVKEELQDLKFSIDQAIKDYPFKCKYSTKRYIYQGNSRELVSRIKLISQDHKNEKSIIVGLTRSSFAKIGAKAIKATGTLLVSVGASTSRLQSYDSGAISIVSPWTRQWDAVQKELQNNGCLDKNTFGLFSQQDSLLMRYLPLFKNIYSNYTFRNEEQYIYQTVKKKKCLYICLNFSESHEILKTLIKKKWQGIVIGTGDWNIFSREIKETLKTRRSKIKILGPTGWQVNETIKNHLFYKSYLKKFSRDLPPIAAYAYDATKLAIDYLCRNNDPRVFQIKKINALNTIRKYQGIGDGGNYLSDMYIVNQSEGINYD